MSHFEASCSRLSGARPHELKYRAMLLQSLARHVLSGVRLVADALEHRQGWARLAGWLAGWLAGNSYVSFSHS